MIDAREITSGKAIKVRQPCPDCGSHDALAVYENGTYCFSCKASHFNNEKKEKYDANLIQPENLSCKDLTSRCIKEDTCKKYGYYVTMWNGKPWQVANYFDDKGKAIGQKLRDAEKNFSVKGKVGDRFFGQHLFEGGKQLIITEGEIDCLSVSQVFGNKYPVVSVPCGCKSAKKVIEANFEWLDKFDKIVLMFDMDKYGREATEEACNVLPLGKIYVASLPEKDANDCLKAGNGQAIVDAVHNAKQHHPDGIVNACDLLEEILKKDEYEEAFGTPWPGSDLEKMMHGGFRKKSLAILTAGTGIGKSTFARELAYHFVMNKGLKVGMIMLEESVKETALSLLSLHVNKRLRLNRNAITKTEYLQAFKEVFESGNVVLYNHFGSTESDNLLNKVRYLAQAEHCDFIILDHISIAISGLEMKGGDERKAIDYLCTQLRTIVESTKVGVIAISHLKRVNDSCHEEGAQVRISDLRGSGSIAQLSDVCLALERNQQAENDEEKNVIKIRILKGREQYETGLAGSIVFDKETGRLNAHKVTQQKVNIKQIFAPKKQEKVELASLIEEEQPAKEDVFDDFKDLDNFDDNDGMVEINDKIYF